jgi:hypothetical protein
VSDIEGKIIPAFCIHISIFAFPPPPKEKKLETLEILSSGKNHPLNGSCTEFNVARDFGIAVFGVIRRYLKLLTALSKDLDLLADLSLC